MKEHGIVFSSLMVRAILCGRKTQTRRVAKSQRRWNVGDRMWVRETWQHLQNQNNENASALEPKSSSECFYRADESDPTTVPVSGRWRPSLYMPRWASRLTLEITGLRTEPVQSITEADAIAEGFDQATCAATFDKAAGKIQPRDRCWIEDEDGGSDCESDLCCVCAGERKLKKGQHLSGDCGSAGETDGPAFCDKCFHPLLVSLTDYGISRELWIEDDPDGKEPKYFPVVGGDARVVHTIADGIGDLLPHHMGRLAQIGFATYWNSLHAKKGHEWENNPWVWVVSFTRIDP